MKRIMMLVMSAFVLATASANAGTYAVVKGDNLSKIGKTHNLAWQAIARANADKIKNPDRIYPGQVLEIPTASDNKQTAAAAVGFTPINSLGLYPFGSKRDGIKAIKMFSLPEEVKALLTAKVQNGEFELSIASSIKKGDRFSEMIFGDYKMTKNRYANWDSSLLEAARLYTAEFEGFIYSLYDPLKCHNWAWRSEKKKTEPEPGPEPEPEPKPEPTPVVEKPVEQPPVVKAEVPEPVVAPPVVDECSISYESYGWLGHYWALKGGGESNYYGGKANFFFCPHETAWGRMREGFGFTINGWDGDNSGYVFRGDRWTIGGVADLITKDGSRFTTSLQVGKQRDRGHDGQGYEAGQDTRILYFGQTADFYNVNKYIHKTENWLDVAIDIGHDKESSWQGSPIPQINDPAENKTSISAGSRVYFWQTESFHGGLAGKGSYAFGDHAIGLEAGPFVSDKQDIVKIGAGFRHQFNSAYETNNGNLVGIGLDLDIVKTIDKIVRYLRTTEKEEGK